MVVVASSSRSSTRPILKIGGGDVQKTIVRPSSRHNWSSSVAVPVTVAATAPEATVVILVVVAVAVVAALVAAELVEAVEAAADADADTHQCCHIGQGTLCRNPLLQRQ